MNGLIFITELPLFPAALEPLQLTGNYRLAAAILYGLLLGLLYAKADFNSRGACLDALTLHSGKITKTLLVALGVGVLLFAQLQRMGIVQQHVGTGYFWGELIGGVISGIGLALVALTPLSALAALGSGRLYAVWILGGMALAIPCVRAVERQLSELITRWAHPMASNLEPGRALWAMDSPPLYIAGICILLVVILQLLLPSEKS